MSEWLKAHPSWTERDYLYKLSRAKITLIAADYTHSVMLDKEKKEKWEAYCKALNVKKEVLTKGGGQGGILGTILQHQEKLRKQGKL